MELAETTTQATPEQVRALEQAFEAFSKQTAELRAAYLELKERAARIDLELEQANRDLQRKVQELDEAYNFQGSILESIPTAVVVTDLHGIINTFNAAAVQMWGVSAQEAVGKHFRPVMSPHHRLLEGVLDRRYRQESVRREMGEGTVRTITSTACLVEDSAGRPIGAIQLDNDITRVQRLEDELCQKEKLADLGRMAAGLAHEIRKPLNGIKGFASLLERRLDGTESERRYLGNIMGAAERLNSMLGRLLDFARPDQLNVGACDLEREAQEVAEFVRAENPGGPVEIRVEVAAPANSVQADAGKLKQVLLNLVKNGVEAVEGEGRVVIGAGPADGGQVCVWVSDDGCGINPGQLERIREPFYSDKSGGTGLGLAIVHRILQLHGSELEIESRPGKGTKMWFLLPETTEVEDR